MIASWSRRAVAYVGGLLSLLVVALPTAASARPFTLFETGQVRPLALSPDGTKLFAVNTPDNRLEIFDVTGPTVAHVGSVAVGLEPLAVAARSNSEVWVVNHLSDSVSVVDVTTPAAARVLRTLLVGDEPRDIVFAGPGGNRAFITTAHRGQNTPFHANIETILSTPGLGRADVWVFDGTNLGADLGGTPTTIVTLFGDTPRALTVSPDGSTVYAAVFHSGNRTTTISEGLVPDGGAANGGLPPPNDNFAHVAGPEVGLIVRYDGTKWTDELGRNWNSTVKFNLPDKDVFAINANANPPVQLGGAAGFYSGVGTILFNMVTNPVSGKVYVANLESLNHVRFEGEGVYASGFKPLGEPASVRGHLAESRITVLDGASVLPRHLNKHIDYGTCCAPNPNTENDDSIAFPLGMAVSSDGATLYVAGFGTSEVGVYSTSQLETNTFTPSAADQIPVSGGGPTGVVLDEARTRLYVLTRFDDSISVVSTATGNETQHVALHNPEPANVVNGRPILYDTTFSSSHGDSSCASCHIFGDFDSLAWDLGNPDDVVTPNPGPFVVGPFISADFHPMKGPMTTQSLRGMANHGPMHWRGDRTGGQENPSAQPDSGAFNEDAAFKKFNPAFVGLIGRSSQLTASEMQAFTDFILQVTYPPNPIRNLDNQPTPAQQAGINFFKGPVSDTFQDCQGCHRLVGEANEGLTDAPGFFGTDGRYSFENETQVLKIPHLRNMYQKVGMFGMGAAPFFNPGDNGFKGDQIRGFGFLHDGSVDTLFRFHNATVFNQSGINATGIPAGAPGDPMRRNIDAFMMAFDSNLMPIVGQQITRTSTNGATVDGRITLLESQADDGACDLVAKARIGGEETGWLYVGDGTFEPSRTTEAEVSDAAIRALANTPGQEVTFTCVPPGSGLRIGVDRDGDGYGDGDELDNASDPSDANSVPSGISPVCSSVSPVIYKSATMSDKSGRLSLKADVLINHYTQEAVSASATDGNGPIFADGVAGTAIVPKGSGFKYKAPKGTTGITDVGVKEKRNSGGIFTVTLKTKAAWPVGSADQDETSTSITLNVGGVCFRGDAKHVH